MHTRDKEGAQHEVLLLSLAASAQDDRLRGLQVDQQLLRIAVQGWQL